jgi:hypothetical protein
MPPAAVRHDACQDAPLAASLVVYLGGQHVVGEPVTVAVTQPAGSLMQAGCFGALLRFGYRAQDQLPNQIHRMVALYRLSTA